MKERLNTQAISPRKRMPLQVVSQSSSLLTSRTHDRVIAVGNVKGGVGKTTLLVNLTICKALRGDDVLLVDGDEQGTAGAFTQLRAETLGEPGYTAVSLRGAEIRTQVRQLRSKYQRIFIDVGGRDTSSLRAALTVADVLVVPVMPATFDVWSLEPLQELIQEAREVNPELKTTVVLNAADPFGKDNDEAAAIIREPWVRCPATTGRRSARRRNACARRRVRTHDGIVSPELGQIQAEMQVDRFVKSEVIYVHIAACMKLFSIPLFWSRRSDPSSGHPTRSCVRSGLVGGGPISLSR
jgi:chromosome partitioning protein